ncbi:hypothetical protein ACINWCA157_2743 [Acinetobacter radioresistens WC-A-157]|nr:hypothetical protein ACINWCA157_2743 [Acinetobacter radioresistens WC-A-157]
MEFLFKLLKILTFYILMNIFINEAAVKAIDRNNSVLLKKVFISICLHKTSQ